MLVHLLRPLRSHASLQRRISEGTVDVGAPSTLLSDDQNALLWVYGQ